MSEPTEVLPVETTAVSLGVVRADRPAELVKVATEAANALASVIESRKLYSNIQGKKFVRCEGWTTLAAMLGVTPHEIGVVEAPEGVFTATVELRRLTDGQPVARASAECGAPDEVDRNGSPIWATRSRNARRSMALTRATGKACRLAFSWIMALSGYEVTPAEEVPHDDERPKREPMPAREAAPPRPAPTPVAVDMPPGWRKTWPFGSLKGRELHTMTSDELVQQKGWAMKSGKGLDLVGAMDDILASRQGE